MPPVRRFVLASAVVLAVVTAGVSLCSQVGTGGYAQRIAQLSEAPGYFDTDNLISNERSYLHVVPALRDAGLSGGAYLGVGPDQNFSYIAQTHPSIAFIIDVRRDNLLLHLLFKALFRLSPTRADYLSLLFGRSPPSSGENWAQADVERIASYVETTGPLATDAIRARVRETIRTFGVALSPEDSATLDKFHRTFIERGLALKFESLGRRPNPSYPTYRDLLLETDTRGQRWNYLAHEADYQFVRSMQERDLVIPVVGSVEGTAAMGAIARLMKERNDRLSAFYVSNVEYYLGAAAFGRFVANVAALPHTGKSVIIRSVFPGRFGGIAPAPGYYSVSLTQRVDDLLDGVATGRIRGYADLLRDR
jgi:hypothetical protein